MQSQTYSITRFRGSPPGPSFSSAGGSTIATDLTQTITVYSSRSNSTGTGVSHPRPCDGGLLQGKDPKGNVDVNQKLDLQVTSHRDNHSGGFASSIGAVTRTEEPGGPATRSRGVSRSGGLQQI